MEFVSPTLSDIDESDVLNLNAKGKSNFYYEKDSVVQVDWFGKGLFVRATIDHYDKKKFLFDISYHNGIKEYGVPLNRLKEPFRSDDSVLIYDTNNYTTGKLKKAKIVKDNLDGTFNIHVQAAKRNGKTNKLLITLDGYNIHEIVSDKLVCEGNYVRIDWEHRHKTSGIFYAARIIKVNGDGTCDVAYLEDLAIDKVQTDQIFRPFMPNEAVTCYWMRSDRAHKGKIQKVNADNTFDIRYDDNDVEKGVPANYILLQESYANRPWLNNEETNLNKIRKQTSDIKEIKKDLEDLGYIRSERQIKTKLKMLLKSKEEEDQLQSVSGESV